MAQRLITQSHNTIEELTYEIKTTRDGRYRLRVQTILLSLQKMRTVDIVKQLLIGRHSVSIWIKLYNQHGLDGLKNFSLGGRREGDVKWSNEIFTAVSFYQPSNLPYLSTHQPDCLSKALTP